MSMLNFIVYFIGSRNLKRYSYQNQKRKWNYQKAMHQGHPSEYKNANGNHYQT